MPRAAEPGRNEDQLPGLMPCRTACKLPFKVAQGSVQLKAQTRLARTPGRKNSEALSDNRNAWHRSWLMQRSRALSKKPR